MTQLLLGQGAKAHISREDFLEFSDSLNAWWLRSYRDDERQILCYYGQDLLQPVEMAIRERDVAMVKLLLEHGATVDSGPKMFFLGCHYGEYVLGGTSLTVELKGCLS
jgi:ankyrin repeat protein